MKEFDENLNSTEELNEESAEKEVSLEEELENIKDMFQAELDKASENPDLKSEQETEEDFSENTEAEDEPEAEPENLCECCGERERDTSLGEDYPYCSQCRDLMKKYPFGFKGILTLVAVIGLIVVSTIFMLPKSADLINGAIIADGYIAEGKVYSGLYTYYDTISSADEDFIPKKLVARCAKAFAGLNDYVDAAYMAQNYLSETELKLPTYSFVKNYTVKSETLNAVENAIYDKLSSADTTADDIDDVIAIIDALGEKEDSNYDEYYLEYYKYVAMHTLKVDIDKQYEKLLEIDKAYGNEWVHCYDLCNTAALMGNVEKAEEYFNRIIKNNAEDGTAYAYYANAYRYCEKPDADKMLEIVEKGIEAQGSYSYATSDLYRIQATAYLLKGEYDNALKSAETMYSAVAANNYSVTNLFECLYTYALTALVADDTEAYENIEGLLEYNKYSVPKSIINAAKSQKALEKLITDTEGELA